MLKLILFISFICFHLLPEICADRILLLADNLSIKKTHASFIKSLEERGHSVLVKLYGDQSADLFKFGEFSYEHLIIFGPSLESTAKNTIDSTVILRFIDAGGNVLIASGPNPGNAIRKIVKELGFEFDSDKTRVIDHLNFDAKLDDGSHTTLTVPSSQLIKSDIFLANKAISPILYRGTGLITESNNPLRLILMTAATSAYSFDPNTAVNEYPGAVGKAITLIGALQARNNARVIVSGSTDLFSDELFNADLNSASSSKSKSGNKALAESLTKWVFKEVGVLRVKSVTHRIVGQQLPPAEYTIMDDVRYDIVIEELKDKKWQPFQASDVQLEFVRIDPFIRTTLKNSNGQFTTEFKVPDVYGVFKFMVDYHRTGYTHLLDVQQVSVRPLTHTQYERFSRCAYPYYVSAYSMMFGLLIFSLVFLYYQDKQSAK